MQADNTDTYIWLQSARLDLLLNHQHFTQARDLVESFTQDPTEPMYPHVSYRIAAVVEAGDQAAYWISVLTELHQAATDSHDLTTQIESAEVLADLLHQQGRPKEAENFQSQANELKHNSK